MFYLTMLELIAKTSYELTFPYKKIVFLMLV